MIDKVCDKIMSRVKEKMPEIDEERANIVRYGFELIIGEIPKLVVMFVLAILLNIIEYFVVSLFVIGTYRFYAGGVHLKTHLGCFVTTNLVYFGNVFISRVFVFPNVYLKCIFILCVYIFSIAMIILYAPADTDMVPILRRKDRQIKKILSMIVVSIIMVVSVFVKNVTVCNICIFGVLLQTLAIMKISYRVFNVKLGYLEYKKSL